MHTLNLALFDALAAGFDPAAPLLDLARAVTGASPWLALGLLAWAAWRHPGSRGFALLALALAGATSVLTKEIAIALDVPRPFMAGLSADHLGHGARGGLPSTHAAVMFALAFVLMLRRPLRLAGAMVASLAVATGWSRIYLGVHYPLDILAGAGVGWAVAMATDTGLRFLADKRPPAIEEPASRAVDRFRPLRLAASRVLMHGHAGAGALLGCTALAVWIGLRTPDLFPMHLMLEDGPVESGTVVLYLLAVGCVWASPRGVLGRIDKAALATVLLAFAAREAHLQGAWLDLGALSMRLVDAPDAMARIASTLGVVVPVALSACWLARRCRSGWRTPGVLAHWRTPATTAGLFALATALAQTLDRAPGALVDWGVVAYVPPSTATVMRCVEEMLELLLPALAILALLQGRWARRDAVYLPGTLPSTPLT
jgi:membrane-associated phospholipid phosphatase